MKDKTYFYLILIVALIFVTACSDNDQPIRDEISSSITEEDIKSVKKLTFHETKENLEFIINDYLKDYYYITINSLDFIEDKLAVEAKNEVKKFNNIQLIMELEIDSEEAEIEIKKNLSNSEKERVFIQFIDDIERGLLNTLNKETPYEFSKIESTSISYIDEINRIHHTSNMGNIRNSETMIALRNEESQEEQIALENLFAFIENQKDKYQLFRFGIENNQLVMEFYEHHTEAELYLSPEDLSDELHSLVIEDESFTQYIDGRAQELIIVFTNDIFEYEI